MMDWYDHGSGWGGWIAMMLIMVVFWGLVILAVVALFRGTVYKTHKAHFEESE